MSQDQYHHGIRSFEVNDGTRAIRTVSTAVIGVVGTAPDADPAEFPLNQPVLILGSPVKAAKAGATGTLPMVFNAIFQQTRPVIVAVRVEENADAAIQASNVIGTITGTGQMTGMKALQMAQTRLKVKPRILGAPGFSHNQPVAAALGTLAQHLRGFAYVDVPAGTKEAAVTFREQFGERRMMPIFPGFETWDTATSATIEVPASAYALGLRAKIDSDIGWHKTLSNVVVNEVTGITADIDWDLRNPNTAAGYLNANEVTTLIQKDGYRFWGSRTCSDDAKFAFESAVRTADIIDDTLAESHFWMIDKPMSPTLLDDAVRSINAKFREWRNAGYIVNAEAWIDPEVNTEELLESGKAFISYDYTPVPPLENLNFLPRITNRYLVEILPSS
ncbi:Putative prophage major tail sheath protein [BD1-7 clade bacterium]|uniref:Prophage major tail sheath protein n=1 Tax=BD1-7 clade bacterium TaxID=2029982 RepID=A0A5S9Q370_9GAMM|nr:Putative prophage major tail sheath protein [BD1-7 clade bacterium]CAA0111820.1 Putative prophage major tail sheath protein [BD1-7 clade bacterium]